TPPAVAGGGGGLEIGRFLVCSKLAERGFQPTKRANQSFVRHAPKSCNEAAPGALEGRGKVAWGKRQRRPRVAVHPIRLRPGRGAGMLAGR
ncbi:MAG: hypothetical protein L0312_04180, partial [Acidobacteria bacterium]|nr:hypothetical protein [Acidobacteriota bacterium]